MRYGAIVVALACIAVALPAQQKRDDGPANEKAQKTYQEALDYLHRRMTGAALDSFKKADKQDDGGHCLDCQRKMIKYGIELHDWKVAETAAEESVEQAQGEKAIAIAHYNFGMVLADEGLDKHKDELFSRAHDEMTKALAAAQNFPTLSLPMERL
jgi:outer membrane protein assembly factor BamD (BamD/ComL family)